MTLKVLIPPSVDLAVLHIDLWWRAHRDKAPDLFEEEFAAAIELLAESPHIGRLYQPSRHQGTRRLLLRSTRFHIYYVVDGDVLSVISIWSAIDGHGPDLGRKSAP